MSNPKISVEISARIYDDEYGYYTAVGPDGDGLGLCTIGYHEGDSVHEFTIPWGHAKALAEAIFDLVPRNQEPDAA